MLRFGIEMLQPSLLIEMAMPALAATAGQKGGAQFALPPMDVAVLVERIADLGFTLIELNTDLNVFFQDSFGLPTVRRLQALRESRKVSYTVPPASLVNRALHSRAVGARRLGGGVGGRGAAPGAPGA